MFHFTQADSKHMGALSLPLSSLYLLVPFFPIRFLLLSSILFSLKPKCIIDMSFSCLFVRYQNETVHYLSGVMVGFNECVNSLTNGETYRIRLLYFRSNNIKWLRFDMLAAVHIYFIKYMCWCNVWMCVCPPRWVMDNKQFRLDEDCHRELVSISTAPVLTSAPAITIHPSTLT